MKTVVVDKAGGPEALQYREVPTPEAGPGWTLVKVRGIGVNHSEVFICEGKSPSVSLPHPRNRAAHLDRRRAGPSHSSAPLGLSASGGSNTHSTPTSNGPDGRFRHG